MDIANKKLIKNQDHMSFNVITFPELNRSSMQLEHKIFMKQVMFDNTNPILIELYNKNFAFNNQAIKHVRSSVATLVWQELGKIYRL